MVMADERPTVPLEQLQDLDWDLLCQVEKVVTVATFFGRPMITATKPCGRPADWMTTCRACGTVGYICDPDRRSLIPLVCGKCLVAGDVYFDFTRIPRPEAS